MLPPYSSREYRTVGSTAPVAYHSFRSILVRSIGYFSDLGSSRAKALCDAVASCCPREQRGSHSYGVCSSGTSLGASPRSLRCLVVACSSTRWSPHCDCLQAASSVPIFTAKQSSHPFSLLSRASVAAHGSMGCHSMPAEAASVPTLTLMECSTSSVRCTSTCMRGRCHSSSTAASHGAFD